MNIHVPPHTRWSIPSKIGLDSVKVGKFGEGEHHMFACWQKAFCICASVAMLQFTAAAAQSFALCASHTIANWTVPLIHAAAG